MLKILFNSLLMKKPVGYYNQFKEEYKEQIYLYIKKIEMNLQTESKIGFSTWVEVLPNSRKNSFACL